jgi:hypothetical protein
MPIMLCFSKYEGSRMRAATRASKGVAHETHTNNFQVNFLSKNIKILYAIFFTSSNMDGRGNARSHGLVYCTGKYLGTTHMLTEVGLTF